MIEAYKRNGFVLLKHVLDPLFHLGPNDPDFVLEEFKDAYRVSVDAYLLLARMVSKAWWVHRIFTDGKLLDCVIRLGVAEPIFNTMPAAHIVSDELRVPGGYHGVNAHQDFCALQSSLDTIVAWVPMFDVTLDDYPLEMVRGSHLLGLLPAKAREHISEVDTTGMEFEPVEPMERGDVLLFSAFTVHRTRTPGTGFRVAFSHRYENASEPTYEARGWPSAQSRVIDRQIKFAPTIDQVRKVFE